MNKGGTHTNVTYNTIPIDRFNRLERLPPREN